ncbi:MAG: tripartite tricarboxylate transporter TctB family protein [Chloroflexota bacterium]
MQRLRLVVGSISLVIALIYVQQTLSELSIGGLARPGAGLYPAFVGVMFIAASLVAVIEPLIAIRKGTVEDARIIDALMTDDTPMGDTDVEEPTSDEHDPAEVAEPDDAKRAIYYFAWLLMFVFTLPLLGFFVTTLVFLIGVSATLTNQRGLRSRVNAVIISILFTLLVDWFFADFLSISMPRGVFG